MIALRVSFLIFCILLSGVDSFRFSRLKISAARNNKLPFQIAPTSSLQATRTKPPLDVSKFTNIRTYISFSEVRRNGSVSLNTLLEMTGLKEVKQSFQSIYDTVKIAKSQNVVLNDLNFNVQMVGNHGIGKTTVAHLYANFLKEIGVLSKHAEKVVLSGSELKTGGLAALQEALKPLKDMQSGVVVIDDAHQLEVSREGQQVMDYIIRSSNKLFNSELGEIVWVLTGATKRMEKLFTYDEAMHSRFPTKMTFTDFSDMDLETIFLGLMERNGQDLVITENGLRKPIVKIRANDTKTNGKSSKNSGVSDKNRLSNAKNSDFHAYLVYEKKGIADVFKSNTFREITVNGTILTEKQGRMGFPAQTQVSEFFTRTAAVTAASKLQRELLQKGFVKSDPVVVSRKRTNQKDEDDLFGDITAQHNVTTTTSAHNSISPTPEQHKFTLEDRKWLRIAVKRLGSGRGKEGFGNALAVRKLFDLTLKRQSARLTQEFNRHTDDNIHAIMDNSSSGVGIAPDRSSSLRYNADQITTSKNSSNSNNNGIGNIVQNSNITNSIDYNALFTITRDDLLGPKATEETFEHSEAWKELQAMEGLHAVKQSVRQLMELVIQNADREEQEKPLLQVALNRLFLGNPGTGKTTVAKLYARILADLGLLTKGEVIYKNPSDFKGQFVGDSEAQTRAILESAMGSVLVIDEAYGLRPSSGVGGTSDVYGDAIIQTIVEQVQGVPGEDRAVVMLGYRDNMEKMLSKANPGLSRRFQLENAFNFEDYDDTALLNILKSVVDKSGLLMSHDTAVIAIKQLAKAKAQPHFGNAGAVNNLFSDAKLQYQMRQKALPVSERSDWLLPVDFIKTGEIVSEEQLFSDLVGCETVREKLSQIQSTIEFAKRLGKTDPKTMCDFNYVFTGNPGTGKTTVARLMGKMFCKLGLIPSEEVVEVSASDLITGFVGQAGKKTKEMLTKARGKVLFIDEAYQLNPRQGGQYMQEVADELVKGVTSEQFLNQMVIILAGYDKNMNDMLSVNPGLKSRFSEKIQFHDFSPQSVETILRKKIADEMLTLEDSAVEHISSIAEQLCNVDNFGNGRDVVNYFKKLYSVVAMRVASEDSCSSNRSDNSNSNYNSSNTSGGGSNSGKVYITVSDLDISLEQFLTIKQQGTSPKNRNKRLLDGSSNSGNSSDGVGDLDLQKILENYRATNNNTDPVESSNPGSDNSRNKNEEKVFNYADDSSSSDPIVHYTKTK